MTDAEIELVFKARKVCEEMAAINDRLIAERAELLAIACELAAKHLKGTVACTACMAVKYMGGVEHNPDCAVVRLEKWP